MNKKNPKIEVRDLCKRFGEKIILDKLSISVKEGESLVILGASGTGKSVFIKTILGILQEDYGEIFIDGDDVTKLSNRSRLGVMRKFGMLFQGGALFDSLPVWNNVAFSLLQGTTKSGKKLSKKEAKEVAIEKLRAVNLSPEDGDKFPAELSGGMQKRVALARAIAGEPDIIFFDEPTTGLDPITATTINHLIRDIVKDLGITAVAITHDMGSVRVIADRVALLHQGKIVWEGQAKEMDTSKDPYIHQFINGLPEGPMKVIY